MLIGDVSAVLHGVWAGVAVLHSGVPATMRLLRIDLVTLGAIVFRWMETRLVSFYLAT
jgi:hypothetical protein